MKTRRGLPYEDKIGLVTKIQTNELWCLVAVNFGGALYTFKLADLEVASERR